jgi:prophage regulatory protein
MPKDHLIRFEALQAQVPAGHSTIYDWMAKGLFPRPVKIGARAVAWRQSDIDRWLEDRARQEVRK